MLLLKQSSWFYSHLGHFVTWERPLDASCGISPRYSSATNFQLTTSSLYRYNMMTDYAFFSQGSNRWGKNLALLWGCLNICPLLQQFHIMSITQEEHSCLTSLKAWGDKENSAMTSLSSWSLLRRRQQGIESMVFLPYG